MNVVEEYADQVQKLNISPTIFDQNGTQICPAEGTRSLIEFAEGCKSWFTYIDHVVCTQLICKSWKNKEVEEGKRRRQGEYEKVINRERRQGGRRR